MGTFKIIKKGNGNFWHNFNNGSKEVNLSNWEIVLDSINQTVSLQMLNGANVPINSVDIADVVVIDETDVSLEETFGSVSALRTRLIELNYTPYIILNGFVPEAPIDGLTYGRKDAGWVEVSGGGSVGTLQQVTDNGNTTTNAIEMSNYIKASEFRSSADDITFTDGSGNPIFFFASTGANIANFDKALLTADRNFSFPDTNGTIALTSNIPTVDATPTDGSSNAVSSNGVFDGLANKVDANATITGATKTKITYDSKGLVTSGADATTADIADSSNKRYVSDAQLVVIGNTSGINTGDNATNSQYSGLATSKQDFATATTGAVISFAVPQVYNSVASPTSSNITNDLTGARIGVVQKIFHNNSSAPTFPAGWVKLGTGSYVNSTLNIIYCEWVSGSRVEYWITQ